MSKKDWITSYFYDVAYKNNIAVQVQIELLTKCNLNCYHCYLPKHNNDGLDEKDIKNILIQLRKMGTVNVTFTGGEIFLRKDIIELTKFARNLHMRVSLLSNATCISEKQIRELANLHITSFSTTIFSLNHNIHDSITGKSGSLEKILCNLQKIKDFGIPIQVKMPIMKSNYMCLEQVHSYCKDNNFDFSASPNIFIKNDGDISPKELRLSFDEMKKVIKKLDEIDKYSEYHSYINRANNSGVCPAIYYSFAIDSYGNVYPCSSFLYKIGNIFENSLEDIWIDSKKLLFLKRIRNENLQECSNCRYKKFCERCPGVAFGENGDLLSCDKMAKMIAKARYEIYEKSEI